MLVLEKINKVDKPLARLTKKGRKKTQITNTRNKREIITTNPMDIKRITKNYCEQLYAHNLKIKIKWINFLGDTISQNSHKEK